MVDDANPRRWIRITDMVSNGEADNVEWDLKGGGPVTAGTKNLGRTMTLVILMDESLVADCLLFYGRIKQLRVAGSGREMQVWNDSPYTLWSVYYDSRCRLSKSNEHPLLLVYVECSLRSNHLSVHCSPNIWLITLQRL